jgi:hypothetical protein
MTALRRLADQPIEIARTSAALGDIRFRTLLGPEGWQILPPAVRARFEKRLGAGASVTYAGTIIESRKNWIGRLLAQACRLIGAPLPLGEEVGVPAVVSVTEDGACGGQFWTRLYGRRRGFPQVIHSSKRFGGPTGLEEYLGLGVGIALRLRAEENGLHFLSDHYFLQIGAVRVRLPRWLGPGALTISHIDRTGDEFEFRLSLIHPLCGEIVRQSGYFRERRIDMAVETHHD